MRPPLSNNKRLLQSTSSSSSSSSSSNSGRQTFGSFDVVGPFSACNVTSSSSSSSSTSSSTSTNNNVIEQVRSAIEDCVRIVMINQNDCVWTTTNTVIIQYVGLGNVATACQSDTTTTTTSSSTTNNNSKNIDDTITIMGGVIDFITDTSSNMIPSVSEVVNCLDIAVQSSTCLETIQIYFPTIDHLDYKYHNGEEYYEDNNNGATSSASPPTLTPVIWTTESSDDIISSSITENGNERDNSSTTPSLVIPLAVVSSFTIMVAMIGFVMLSKIRKSRHKQHKPIPVHDLTTNSTADDSSNSSSNSINEADEENGHVVELFNPIDVGNIVNDDDDDDTPITEDDSITVDDDEDDDIENRNSMSPTSSPVVEDVMQCRSAVKCDNNYIEDEIVVGYVSSDSDTELEVEYKNEVIQQFPTDGIDSMSVVVTNHNDDVVEDPLSIHHQVDHNIIIPIPTYAHDPNVLISTTTPLTTRIGPDFDDNDDDDEDFALDHSWDPDDNSITSITDLLFKDEDNFSVTRKHTNFLSSSSSSIILKQSSPISQKKRQYKTNTTTTAVFRHQKSFMIPRRKKDVVEVPSLHDTEVYQQSNIHHHHNHQPSNQQQQHESHSVVVESVPTIVSKSIRQQPQPSLQCEQFRRSRSFVILLPTTTTTTTTTNHSKKNQYQLSVDESTRRCRSTPRLR